MMNHGRHGTHGPGFAASGYAGASPGGLASMLQTCLTMLMLAICLFAMGLQPFRAEAAVTREVVTISQDDTTTQSVAGELGYDATISSAWITIPTDVTSTTHTVILRGYAGSEIGEIDLATQTITSTGTVSLTSWASLPVAGVTRCYVQSTAAEAADRTYRVWIFYTR